MEDGSWRLDSACQFDQIWLSWGLYATNNPQVQLVILVPYDRIFVVDPVPIRTGYVALGPKLSNSCFVSNG